MTKKILFLTLTGSIFTGITHLVNAETLVPFIPVVPIDQAQADLPPPPATKHKTAKKSVITPVVSKSRTGVKYSAKINLKVKPGVNEIIPVAQNHLNRIITPFENPKITTSSKATKKIRDNVVYIGTKEDGPLTLFITEDGSEEEAISLTLIPKKIPPREINLDVGAQAQGVLVTKQAKKWETSQKYMTAIYKTMSSLANGDIPPGYKLTEKPVGRLPQCRQTSLSFDFKSDAQSAVGHHLIYHIGVATNNGPVPIEFMEESCGDWDIAAVASFPRIVLGPGEQTEVFVAEKRNYKKSVKKSRRSLLRGK